MNETIIKRLGNLLSVKSLVTLALTVVFAVMTVRQAISQDFMTRAAGRRCPAAERPGRPAR